MKKEQNILVDREKRLLSLQYTNINIQYINFRYFHLKNPILELNLSMELEYCGKKKS